MADLFWEWDPREKGFLVELGGLVVFWALSCRGRGGLVGRLAFPIWTRLVRSWLGYEAVVNDWNLGMCRIFNKRRLTFVYHLDALATRRWKFDGGGRTRPSEVERRRRDVEEAAKGGFLQGCASAGLTGVNSP